MNVFGRRRTVESVELQNTAARQCGQHRTPSRAASSVSCESVRNGSLRTCSERGVERRKNSVSLLPGSKKKVNGLNEPAARMPLASAWVCLRAL